jgi:hypothetical protein
VYVKRAAPVKPFALAAASVLAAPALLAAAAVALVAGAMVGWEPFWSEPQLNLAEAAALNDRGTIQRLIASGADPNARAPVRAPILKSHEIVVTPLEAAVGTRTPATIEFLLMRGARMDSHERAVMFCLAMKDEAREIIDFLDHTATEPHADCEHVATPW